MQVGPQAVRVLAGGTGSGVPAETAEAALLWIDDPVGLLGESPVAVADLWRAVMVGAAGSRCEEIVVVHPRNWPTRRIDRVLAAANTVADRVSAVRLGEWTSTGRRDAVGEDRPPPRRRRVLPLTAAALAIVAAGATACWTVLDAPMPGDSAPPAPSDEAAPIALREGRIAVQVPREWTVQRITGGPGSRRVQVSSPADPGVALHITQAYAPETTLAETAAALGRAIADQPAGIFLDFRPEDAVAGRPAVTSREVRPGREVRWAVLAAGSGRISIGCQSPPDRAEAVAAACAEALRSARHQ